MHKKFGSFLFGLLIATSSVLLGQVPVSSLPPATLPLTGNESVVMNQNGTTKQGKVSSITSLVNLSAATGITLTPNPIVGGAGTIGLTLPVAASSGGTGELGVITGIPKANGSGAFTAASSSDVPIPGANTQILYNSSGILGASSLMTFTPASVVLNLGAATTPGTFSVGQLDTMVVNGVTVPIPSFAANSNIQGVIENHSYVNGVASGGARYYGVRSEGTIASPSIVSNGDHLMTFLAAGYNGTSYSLGAQIQALVNGTPGASAMPTDLDFAVSAAGSQVPTSRLTLKTDGSYAVSGAVGSTGSFLRSAGTGSPAAWSSVIVPNAATTGDIWYGSASNTISALAGNTTTAQQFLSSTGTGAAANAPVWSGLPGSFSGFANPTASVGLTTVNGVATTAMRSDASPPIDQTISPTWTGTHTFTEVGSFTTQPIKISNSFPYMSWNNTVSGVDSKLWGARVGSTGSYEVVAINDAQNAGKLGLQVTRSGTTISSVTLANNTDAATVDLSGTGGVSAFHIAANGMITQPEVTGTFTATLSSGCTTTPSGTASYTITGVVATITFPALSCTSNATSLTLSGAPTILAPATICANSFCGFYAGLVEDNGTNALIGCFQYRNTGNFDFGLSTVIGTHIQCAPSAGWTASGTKGFAQQIRVNYSLN